MPFPSLPFSRCWLPPAPPAPSQRRARPGSATALYPTLGNGGYDVLPLRPRPALRDERPGAGVDGTVTIVARATQSLSRFDLDFGGDGRRRRVASTAEPRSFTRDGEELVITPAAAAAQGPAVRRPVAHFTATPTVADSSDDSSTAFFITPDGSATAAQPNCAHLVYALQRPPARQGDVHVPLRRPGRRDGGRQRRRARRTEHARGRTHWTYCSASRWRPS